MRKKLLKLGVATSAILTSLTIHAQCPTISCPGDIVVNNDPGTCGAVVNYVTPVGTDACSSGGGSGNVLFVADGVTGTASEIPAELTSAGYTVTSVYSDFSGGDNAVLQGLSLIHISEPTRL